MHTIEIQCVRQNDDKSIEVCYANGVSHQYNSHSDLVQRARELHESADLAEQIALAAAYALDPTLTKVDILAGKKLLIDFAAIAGAVLRG